MTLIRNGLLSLFSWWMIIGSIAYATVGFYPWARISTIIAGLLLCAITLPDRGEPIIDDGDAKQRTHNRLLKSIGIALIIICSATALAILFSNQTTESIRSPWDRIPWWWVLLPVLSLLAYGILTTTSDALRWLLGVFVIAPIVLAPTILVIYGAGFDAHLHAASLREIDLSGHIEPLTPYYIGYYVATLILSTITGIAPDQLNVWIVPITATIFIPSLIGKNNFRLLLFFLFPLFWITESTPQSFAFLGAMTVLILWKERTQWGLTVLMTIATLMIHPIAGLPLLFAFLDDTVVTKRLWIRWFVKIGWILAIPILFIGMGLRAGYPLQFQLPNIVPTISLPQQFHPFLDPLFALLLNRWILLIPIVMALVFFDRRRSDQQGTSWLIRGFAFTLLSSVVLSMVKEFPNIISYESSDYARRLAMTAFLFLIPSIMEQGALLVNRIIKALHSTDIAILISMIGIIVLTGSLYTLYPINLSGYRVDKGYSIGLSDIEAVRWIADDAGTTPFIVLSNQAVSAAAVREFGFKKYYNDQGSEPIFYYAIPTGGKLYSYYLRYVYESPTLETVSNAAQLVGVDRVYVVINQYWSNAALLIRQSRTIATVSQGIENGQNWVFRFDIQSDKTAIQWRESPGVNNAPWVELLKNSGIPPMRLANTLTP